jgi:hypothetical protein
LAQALARNVGTCAAMRLAEHWVGKPVGQRERGPQAAETASGRVAKRGAGTDRSVVAMKPRNLGGAKGADCSGSLAGQPRGKSR